MLAPALLAPTGRLPAIDLEPVAAGPMQKAFTEITSISFEIPFGVAQAVYAQDNAWKGDYRGFVGLAGTRPVSIVAIVPTGDVLGVYSLATHPAFRRLGYAEATLRAAIAEMQRRTGIERIALQSTEAGDLAFILMDPRSVMPEYTVQLGAGELAELAGIEAGRLQAVQKHLAVLLHHALVPAVHDLLHHREVVRLLDTFDFEVPVVGLIRLA